MKKWQRGKVAKVGNRLRRSRPKRPRHRRPGQPIDPRTRVSPLCPSATSPLLLPPPPAPTLSPIYTLTVHREFCAAHALTIGGEAEPLHGHNWKVEAVVEGDVNDDGLLCDFHDLEAALDKVLAPLNNGNLNEIAPFDVLNPSAEHVARHICEEFAAGLGSRLGAARVASVSVSEAPGCIATYRPEA